MPNNYSMPMFDPSGTLRWIPNDKLDWSAKNGAQRALLMTDPQGTQRWIPASRSQWALQNGAKFVPADEAEKAIEERNQQFSGSEPKSGALARFLSSGFAPVASTARGLLDWAPTEEEKQQGRTHLWDDVLRLPERFAQAQIDEGKQSVQNVRNAVSDPEHRGEDISQAIGHGVAAVTPGYGPWVAGAAEKLGSQLGAGDVAGAAGTALGNAALMLTPKGVDEAKAGFPEKLRATLKDVAGISPVDMRKTVKDALQKQQEESASQDLARAKAKEQNDKTNARYTATKAKIEEENAALDHTLDLRRQKEADLQKKTDAYRALEASTDAKAKAVENAKWAKWREKMAGATIDAKVITDPLSKLRQISPEVERTLHQLEPKGDEVPQESHYAQLRDSVAKGTFGSPYDSLSPEKQEAAERMASSIEPPDPIEIDMQEGAKIPVDHVQRAYSILQRYIRSNRFEGPLLGEMKQVSKVLRNAITQASTDHGAAPELENARSETIRYQEAFGRERPEPKTVRGEREKTANPEEVKRLQEEERLEAAAKYAPSLADAQRGVRQAREDLRKLPAEEVLRKRRQQVPNPPSMGDTRTGYAIQPEEGIKTKPLSPKDIEEQQKEAILEKGAKMRHSPKGNLLAALGGAGVSTWGLAYAFRGRPEIGVSLVAAGALVGMSQRALGALLSHPAVADWLKKPTEGEISVIQKMSPEQKQAFGENLKPLLDEAKRNKVSVSSYWTHLTHEHPRWPTVAPAVLGGAQIRKKPGDVLRDSFQP